MNRIIEVLASKLIDANCYFKSLLSHNRILEGLKLNQNYQLQNSSEHLLNTAIDELNKHI
jgi:hypothetical protein